MFHPLEDEFMMETELKEEIKTWKKACNIYTSPNLALQIKLISTKVWCILMRPGKFSLSSNSDLNLLMHPGGVALKSAHLRCCFPGFFLPPPSFSSLRSGFVPPRVHDGRPVFPVRTLFTAALRLDVEADLHGQVQGGVHIGPGGV